MGIVRFLTVAGLLFANAFFVAAEFALVKVRVSQIEHLAESGNWAARLTNRLLDRLDAYISASQLGITLASLGLGWAIHDSIEPFIHAVLVKIGVPAEGFILGDKTVFLVPAASFFFVTFLHIVLGELVPKSLAIRSAKVIALWTAPPLLAFYYVFFPLIWVLNRTSDMVLWALRLGKPSHKEVAHSEEELRHILAESVEGGQLTRHERLMIENVLRLEEKSARRVMVPRPDVVYLSLARSLDENLRLARQTGHTRFPLCETDLTQVVGLIHVKDLFRAGQSEGRPDLRKLAREVVFLSEKMHLDQILVEFQRNRVHLAMLVDQFGIVTGIITLENVLEEVVGPIQDEFDREQPDVTVLDDETFEVAASVPLDRLAELCHIEPPKTEADTTGGLIVDRLGRLARVGDAVEVDGHRLTVIQADRTRIRRVRVQPVGHGSKLEVRSPTTPEALGLSATDSR